MRNLLVALFVVGLVAASSFGAISVQLLANASVTTPTVGNLVAGTGTNDLVLNPGDTAVIRGFFVGNGAGLNAIGGDVVATVVGSQTPAITSSGFSYLGTFNGIPPVIDPDTEEEVPNTAIPSSVAVAGLMGGYTRIGSAQGSLIPSGTYGASTYKSLFSYTITAGDTPGVVNLNWVEAPTGGYAGWYTTTTTGVNGIGSASGLKVTVTPEPATMALLALGGLLVARRRHA